MYNTIIYIISGADNVYIIYIICYIVLLYYILPAVLSSTDRRNTADTKNNEPESTYNEDMPVDKLLEAEMAVEPSNSQYVDSSVSLHFVSASVCVSWWCHTATVNSVLLTDV